jgi:uncharacterized protein
VPAPLCVFCRKHAVDPLWRPFCSERCKLLDLANWADGRYTVASQDDEVPDDDDDKKDEGDR